MLARIITIQGHAYSEHGAEQCRLTAQQHGVDAEISWAVTPHDVESHMQHHGLAWTWADHNTRETVCPYTGLHHFPYRARDVRTKMACSMSHYLLWKESVASGEDVLILEHDARFQRDLPEIDFHGACQINDPRHGGYRGAWHSDHMQRRGTVGVHALTAKREPGSLVPDGFSGGSAYIVKPHAAQQFISAYHRLGVWPNDATICLQLFPWLEEYYPFITWIDQHESTTT